MRAAMLPSASEPARSWSDEDVAVAGRGLVAVLTCTQRTEHRREPVRPLGGPYPRRVAHDHDDVAARLAGHRFSELRWTPSTGSTNADLLALARQGHAECALVADHQDAGRGRLERRWQAPPGASLLMSVLVRPPYPQAGPHLLSTAVGVAAVRALEELGGLEVGLKWPNDVVAPGAGADGQDLKLGGLLAELHTGEGGDAVVVGLGVNLAWADVGFPPELAGTATSVDLLGADVSRQDLVVALLAGLDVVSELAGSAAACARLSDQHRAACVTIGRRVRIELPRSELVGTATDLADDGALLVTDDAGEAHRVTVGDVVHLRPA